jgi:hypothetical protein
LRRPSLAGIILARLFYFGRRANVTIRGVSLRTHWAAVAAALICSACSATSGPETASAAPQPAPAYDLIIANGRVVDGSGAPWFRADVGIVGDRITAIGDLHDAPAGSRLDASGLVVAPGFIDLLGQSEFNVLVDNRAASKILQGVTTEITGEGSRSRRSPIASSRKAALPTTTSRSLTTGTASASTSHASRGPDPPSTSEPSSARAPCGALWSG